MRTTMLFLAAGAAALGACKWTEFDDLQNETWVGSTEKPNVRSADYGIALQRGAKTPSGGTLIVIGANQPTYSELEYDAKGGSKLTSNTLELNTQFGVGTIDAQPIVLADPSSDDIAFIVNGGGSQILGLVGTGQLDRHDLFVAPSNVDAATYMQPPARFDNAMPQPPRPLVASGEFVLGVFTNPEPAVDGSGMHVRCRLTDAGTSITPRALGAARVSNPSVDDVIAWGANGKLYRYKGDVFNGCSTAPTVLGSHDVGFRPEHGSQILAIDATHVLLQGHHDADPADADLLQVYDAMTMNPVGGAVSLGKLRTAAILDTGAQKYVIAGYPAAIPPNQGVASGVVMLFKVSAAGIDSQPAAVLSDAQPEANQSFGRAVAAVPYNGKQVVAVAANNEIFMYFRLNTTDGTAMPIYGETRQGR